MSLTIERKSFKPILYPWAIQYWKDQHALHWLADEVPMGDDVRDFKTRLTPEEKNLLTQVLRLFIQMDVAVSSCYHNLYKKIFKAKEVSMMLTAFEDMECFDKESELLTVKGWKKCPDITEDDLIAQYDIDTKKITFVKPKKVVKYFYKGKMHHYKNTTTDICVTPNHKLILEHPISRVIKKNESKNGKWGRNYLYPTTGKAGGDHNSVSPIERVLIALAADGSMRGLCPTGKESIRTADICFSKERKIQRMRDLLTQAGIEFSERLLKNEGDYKERVNFCFRIPEGIELNSIKNLDFISLVNIGNERAAALVDEILEWVSSKRGKNFSFYSTNREAIDKFQSLCILSGKSASIGVNRSAKVALGITLPNGKAPKSTKDCYVVTVSGLPARTYPNRVEVDYEDYVYCVSVDTENLVSRRNGKVAMTGNTVHIQAYSHLLDTLGYPDTEYSAFMKYKEMRDKDDYFKDFNADSPFEVAKTLAGVSAFGEGVALFASFAMLLNFSRPDPDIDKPAVMKGVGDIVAFSMKDESLHCDGMMQIYHEWLKEHPEIDREKLSEAIRDIAIKTVQNEDAFVDLAFEMGPVKGLTPNEVKQYNRYMVDFRLKQLKEKPIFMIDKHPLPWLTVMLGQEFGNFFETRVTDYSKASTTGDWNDDAYDF